MAVNKVEFGDETLIDLTQDTAEAGDVAAGKYFHTKNGVRTVGTGNPGTIDVDDELSPTSENPVQNKVIKAALDNKAGSLIETASGMVATFIPDRTITDANIDVSVDIKPVQDLHGYDSPWPAGGGKNLIVPRLPSTTVNGITMTNNGDGSFTFVGTASASASFRIDQTSNTGIDNLNDYVAPFTISLRSNASVGRFTVLQVGSTLNLSCGVNSSATASANISGAFAYITFASGDTVNDTFYPQIESGSTATAWKPYSNICPISGWDAVDIMHSGADTSDPTTYTIALGQTVYGGTLDVAAGKMYSRPYFPSYNGQALIGPWVSSMDAYTPGATPTVGAQVVDMGGAVTEIALDPVTISAIAGQTNNVWADASPVTVEYAADLTTAFGELQEEVSGKQDAPTDTGASGQVLGLDDDLNPVWLDQSGGGGGTTNYNNLTNKPRINGVLLSGDKSGADLGLASASDIPTVPVQSVNGEIGAVVLDASDVGAVAEPQTAGTAGQVLGLDSNLNPTWVNQGGGGSSDYNALSNKPQIDGVTLSGNKTASDLGLAKASDIPTVPVQSVNGKTGTVVLSASDVGALPSSTAIPSKTSDLTNDSGFVNAAGAAAAAPVQSVNGNTGAVTVQSTITASGILKGDGSGGVSAAVAGTDYLTPATNYSPVVAISAGSTYSISTQDIGKTLFDRWTSTIASDTVLAALTRSNSANIPAGAEIAFTHLWGGQFRVSFDGVRLAYDGSITVTSNYIVSIPRSQLCAVKKILTDANNGDIWLLTGNVEVVT